MDMGKIKKPILVVLLPIILIVLHGDYLLESRDISTSIIFLYNSFHIDKLIDISGIVIYSAPIAILSFVIAFRVNAFYENYVFLVTRLGGQAVFRRTLLIKTFKESFILVAGAYIITIALLVFNGQTVLGNIYSIIISLFISYTTVTMLIIILIIFRIYHSFSISFTFTYFIQISLLVIGLFLKYMKLHNILSVNPLMRSIMFFHGETLAIDIMDPLRGIIVNLVLIIILIVMYSILLWKREDH